MRDNDVAIIGMSCRYPGSPDIASFWDTIVGWKDRLTRFDDPAGSADSVRSFGSIDWIAEFDADFFGFSDSDANLLDPQQRLFLEHSYRAFEDAGIAVADTDGDVWVFAGCWMSTYLINCVLPERAKELGRGPTFLESAESLSWMVANDKDYLATRVSYKLNLKWPSMTVQSACSTSLLAVAQAVSSLRSWECGMALAWWATVVVPQLRGYEYQEGLFFSKDGDCRPFTSESSWTVFANGVGVVLLKRYRDAMRDGDRVYAVIKGVGVSNDWSGKAGYSSPSVSGQESAIRRAIEDSGIDPELVEFVETHGTATRIGDAIEIDALKRAYGVSRAASMSIGAVKANIGHTAWASWIAGLIKAALCVSKGTVPAQLFSELSVLDWNFVLPKESSTWKGKDGRRYAWVSSFWLGGTNVHAIIEGCSEIRKPLPSSPHPAILPVSAKNAEAAKVFASACAEDIDENRFSSIEAFSQSVATGRPHFPYRWFAIGTNGREMCESVSSMEIRKAGSDRTVFLFTGYWCQYAWMGKELYSASAGFSRKVDEISEICAERLGFSLRDVLWGEESEISLSRMDRSWVAIFAIQCAIAEAYSESGIRPSAVLGHSHGEFAAAYVAGMLELEDAVVAVHERWKLLQSLDAKWSMLAVFTEERSVEEIIGKMGNPDLGIAALNGDTNVVVSWTVAAVRAFSEICETRWIRFVQLPIRAAGHSPVVDEILSDFSKVVRGLSARKGTVPYYSALLGRKADYTEINHEYWVSHMRRKVDFLTALRACDKTVRPGRYVEIGPKDVLTKLVPWIFDEPKEAFSAFCSSGDGLSGFLRSVWTAYATWANVDWNWHGKDFGRTDEKISVPGYPLNKKVHWIGDEGLFRSVDKWVESVRVVWEACPFPSVSTSGTIPLTFVPGVETEFDSAKTLVVHIRENHGSDVWNAVSTYLEAIRKWIKSAEDAGTPAKVVVVTENSKAVVPDDVPSNVVGASFYGLEKVLALENPDNRVCFVDLDIWSEAGLDFAIREVASGSFDRQIAIRNGSRYRSKLVRGTFVGNDAVAFDTGAAYVVTGWSKWIGPHCAKKLVEMGARRVFLLWRSENPSEFVKSLVNSPDTRISYRQCDVTDSRAVTDVLSEVSLEHRIGGVIHAAGVVHDGIFIRQDFECVRNSFYPKAIGAENLVSSLNALGASPDFVMFFSSATAVVGNAWQSSHAMANAYLDALAIALATKGYPAVSVNWGVWEGVGAVSEAGSEKVKESTSNFWFVPFGVDAGLKAMSEFILGGARGQIGYVPADWTKIESAFSYGAESRTAPDSSGDATESCFYETFKKKVGQHENFFSCWMDSLTALIFRNKLQKAFGRPLPPNVAYAHPTISSLREYLSVSVAPVPEPIQEPAPSSDRVAETAPTEQQIRWVSLVELGYGKLLVPIVFDSPFSADGFQNALKSVVVENPVLHSIVNADSVRRLDDNGVDEICKCPIYDIRSLDDEGKRQFLKDRKDDAYSNSPDHRTGVSWRGECVITDDDRFLFLLLVQHLEFDWTAITSFVDALSEAYAWTSDVSNPKPANYDEFARWQRKYLKSPAFGDDRRYFQEKYSMIASIPSLDATGHSWKSCHPSFCHTVDRMPGLWDEIRLASEVEGVSPFSIMARTYSVLLSWITGSLRPVFWTVVQGRPSDEFDRTIWPFVTHFPICVDLESWTESDQCHYIHDFVTNINARCAYPVSDLIKSVPAFSGEPIHTYFCDAFIMMNNYPRENGRKSRVRVLESLGPLDWSVFSGLDTGSLNEMVGLFLIIDFHEGEVRCNFWYHEHRFSIHQVEEWAKRYFEILRKSISGVQS